MIDDHSDENQSPEEVLRCSLCDAVFYHLDAYELHLTFHSFDDIYSEKNEKIKMDEITEFSLESMPPLMEMVENGDGGNPFIESLLDAETGDSNNEYILGKTKKKHKKHKKAKKSAITLDEFLNMNKDVFGEGIDFQGIEEVPTRAVTKRLKVKKQKPASTDLEKLKKQGIIVKVKQPQKLSSSEDLKSDKKTILPKPTKLGNNVTETKFDIQKHPNILTTSNEVLSKLLNQSNNQIKIVKKSTPGNVDRPRSLSPENIEVTCDVIQNMAFYSDGEKESDDLNLSLNEISINKDRNSPHSTQNVTQVAQENSVTSESPGLEGASDKTKQISDTLELENKNKSSSLVLKNISQQITIKSMNQSSNKIINDLQTLKSCHNEEDTSEPSESLCEDVNENNSKNIEEQNKNDSNKSSLKVLKNLSHITVTPLSQSKNIEILSNESTKKIEPEKDIQENKHSNLDEESSQEYRGSTQMKSPDILNQKETTGTSDVWKNLNKKNITIKTLPQSFQPYKKVVGNFTDTRHDECEEDDNFDIKTQKNQNKVLVKNNMKTKLCDQNSTKNNIYPLKNLGPEISIKPPSQSPTPINKSLCESQSTSKQIPDDEESNSILKNLKNVTAKPLGGMKNVNKKYDTNSSQCIDFNKGSTIKTFAKTEQNEIEIFNIDDSDSDDTTTLDLNKSQVKCKLNVTGSETKVDHKNDSMNSIDALKNISKSITIKSMKRHSTHINKIIQRKTPNPQKNTYETDSDNSDVPNNYESEPFKDSDDKRLKNNIPLKALKNLGKHITIKSQKSSTNFQNQNSQCSNNEEMNYDTDSDVFSDDQKITEINEFNESDDEILSKQNNTTKDPVVQFPNDSDSDNRNDYDEEVGDHLSDIESQIKTNKLRRLDQNITQKSSGFEKLGKNVSKESNIKKEVITEGDLKSDCAKQKPIPTLPHNICKDLSIKPIRQSISPSQNTNRVLHRPTSRPAKNSNNTLLLNETNTLNKEVTVKTIQTETVIQEITTTVTKTIRTVNQTVQQVGNASETPTPVKIQKLKQDISSNQQVKNYQGMKIRHASPNVHQIRNSGTPICRPAVNTVRPSNQLVCVRPGLNPRLMTPKTPPKMKITPSTSKQTLSIQGQKPIMGKPLKISPNVLNSPIKRPAQRESNGPFSCFKKPKESLIPVSDVPSFSGHEDSTIQCASASYESSSNFTSTVSQTIKGDSVVTTQTKKVSCNSQQQLSKLNNITGLKIMKASRREVSQSEERSEISASKRTTLEAIEKLQKQGLLVKKPRVDIDNSDNNNSDDDNTEPYVPEENDE